MKHVKNLYLAILLCVVATSSMAMHPGDRHERKHEKAKPITITAVYDFSTYPEVYGRFFTSGAFCIYGSATMKVREYNHGCFATSWVELCTEYGTITIKEKLNLKTNCGKWQIICGTGKYENLKGHGTLTRSDCTEVLCGVVREKKDKDHDWDDNYHDGDYMK